MTISFTIDDKVAQQVRDGFCAATAYDPKSGISQDDWIKQKGILWFKAVAKAGIAKQQQGAIDAAVDPVPVT